MVFESLIDPAKAAKKPWEMFFIGLIYSSLGILLSLWIFKGYVSLVMIFLTVLACAHIMINAIQIEETKSKTIESERILIKEHGRTLSFFMFLFLGFVVSFTLWFVFLPPDVAQSSFKTQISIIQAVNGPATGHAINPGAAFVAIFSNNVKVLMFCMLFAFFYGAGAIFILGWNASVIGAAIGGFAKNAVSNGVMAALSLGFLRYMIHGVIEIAAYFAAGLAAGIISVAVVRHDYGTPKFKNVLRDSIDLTVLAIILLVVGAVVEVFVTPALF